MMRTRPATVCAAILLVMPACKDAGSRAPGESQASTSASSSTVVAEQPSTVVAEQPAADSTPSDVVRRYYLAIQASRYDDAYALWSDSGRASGKSLQEFAAGFRETANVRASVGDSAHVEGAAGSQYATVPVTVDATLRSGARQHFTGTYTLRRSMVDGASAEQRQWRIYSADIH
jgi:hypothetical protein